jgi:hypothetical protein
MRSFDLTFERHESNSAILGIYGQFCGYCLVCQAPKCIRVRQERYDNHTTDFLNL